MWRAAMLGVAAGSASALAQPADVDDLFPRGRLFPCAAYSVGGEDGKMGPGAFGPEGRRVDLLRAKAMGLNVIGPQYELNSQVLADAAALDMHAIFSVGPALKVERWVPTPEAIEEVRRAVEREITAVAGDRRIAWWYLRQEEIRHWRPNEMRYLETVSRAIRKADPLGRPLMMYEPGHREATDLVLTGRHLGLVTMGVYVNYMKLEGHRAWVAAAVRRQLEAARAGGGKPVLFVPEMFANATDRSMIPVWTAHDILRAVAEGAQGVVLFSMRRRLGFSDHGAYLDGYAAVMKLICGDAPLGQALLFGEPYASIRVRQTVGQTTVAIRADGVIATAEALGVAVRRHRGSLFVIVVNSSPEQLSGELQGLPSAGSVEQVWGSPSGYDARTGRIDLGPWEAIVVKTRAVD